MNASLDIIELIPIWNIMLREETQGKSSVENTPYNKIYCIF